MTRLNSLRSYLTKPSRKRVSVTSFKNTPPRSAKERVGSAYAKCFGSARYRRMNDLLLYLALRGLGFENWRNHNISGEEAFLRMLLDDIQCPIILDVGAYQGEYAKLVRWYSPSATIYCFEPHPISFETLQRAALDAELIPLRLACGAESGTCDLFDHASNDGSKRASFFAETLCVRRVAPLTTHQIEVVTIDEFASTHGIDIVELLKVDVEGAELAVLQGARELIKDGRIRAIQFELSYVNAVRRKWMRDFYDLLNGYSFYRLVPNGLVPLGKYDPATHELFRYQNLVALLGAR